MPYFYVSAFDTAGSVAHGYPVYTERVAIPGTTAAIDHPESTPTNMKRLIVRIATDADCQYLRGTSPAADAQSECLFAGQVEHVDLVSGDKFSVIAKVA